MATKTVCITQTQTKAIKILKWKISAANPVSIGRILLLYDFVDSPKSDQRRLKSQQAGTVRRIVAAEGDIVKPGEVLFELEPCSHPTIMNDMCAECGADLRRDDAVSSTASVPMVHAIPDLKVSEELAQKIGKADNERLLKDRKLVLLVDLDQTLIHTTNDNIPANLKNVYHFQLYGPTSPWYHTRLRPRTHQFLNNIYDYFELHICTFGARNYAHMIALFLDADQRFFSNRILSRDECFDPTSKKANLKALFPCGDDMVCIIDDREDVWSHASNLIHVKPYHFFKHTGDINAPPGLDKQENDDKEGVDLTDLAKLNGTSKNEIKSDTTNSKEDEIVKTIENKENVQIIDEDIEKDEKDNENVNSNEALENPDQNSESKEINIPNENKKSSENGENTIECETALAKSNTTSNVEIDQVKSTENKSEPENPTNNVNDDEKTNENKDLLETNTNSIKSSTSESNANEHSTTDGGNDLIEVEDPDDYLIYLEDILKRIHNAFYDEFDKMQSGAIPDLKNVIPAVRSQVLKDCNLVFSGLVPTHLKLEQSKAYQVARSLGAKVTQDLEDDSTHLVAVRPGTAKVNAGRRKKHLKIVTPDWLWCCAERWEHVDERIFPLNSKGSKNRHPPPHCSSPDHIPTYPEHETPAMRKRTPSGRFMDTINPLMSFSSDDIADMDKEVEDILDNESSEDDEDKPDDVFDNDEKEKLDVSSSSSSDDDSLTGEFPKGFKRKRIDPELDEVNNSTEDDESPVDKFRRGEAVEDECDMEVEEDSDSVGSLEPPDEVDDGEWNIMGAALEREFLSNN